MELNKIYHENCLETMSRMEDNFIDITVTSPPYDNLRDYKGYEFDFKSIAKELFRVTKTGGVVVWVVGDQTINGSETGTSFKQALYFKETGFNLHDTMIYNRPAKFPETTRYYPEFEYMFIFSKEAPKSINLISDRKNKYSGSSLKSSRQRNRNGGLVESSAMRKGSKIKDYSTRGNVWFISNGFNLSTKDEIAFKHPAIFPEKLVKDHIYSWSNEGDLVYDPFMGSGTTAKMSHLMKRNWIGSEISKEYVKLANKRIDPYLKQLTLI